MASARSKFDESNWCFNCCVLTPPVCTCVISLSAFSLSLFLSLSLSFSLSFSLSNLALPVVSVQVLRNIVRQGYNIEGNCCLDILCGCCLMDCAICQTMNEVWEAEKKQRKSREREEFLLILLVLLFCRLTPAAWSSSPGARTARPPSSRECVNVCVCVLSH
jgi:Cys-rich protein (TIGR01571 family)